MDLGGMPSRVPDMQGDRIARRYSCKKGLSLGMTNADSTKMVERQGQKNLFQGVQMMRLGCGPSWRVHEFNLRQVCAAKEGRTVLGEEQVCLIEFLVLRTAAVAPWHQQFVADFRVKM